MTPDESKREVDAIVKQEPSSEDEQCSRDVKDALKHNLQASNSAHAGLEQAIAGATKDMSKAERKRLKKQRHRERKDRAQLLIKQENSGDSDTARSSPTKS